MSEPTDLYRYYDGHDTLLYVGISKSAIARAIQHEARSGWWEHYARMTREVFPTREAALEAERAAIVTERPLHNVVHNTTTSTPRRANEMPTKEEPPKSNEDPLVGRFVHTYTDEVLHYQGRIDANVGEGFYLVQWFEFGMGFESDAQLVETKDMTEWKFYPTREAWLDAYRDYSDRRDRRWEREDRGDAA